MSKILLLNGPRNCGKSETTRMLKEHFSLVERPCKAKLFNLTIEFFNLTPEEFGEIYRSRALKEVPLPEFTITGEAYEELRLVLPTLTPAFAHPMQLSCRQAMIYVSEVICKPTFGEDYFGVARAKSILDDGELAIDDSCGFDEEVLPVIEKLGAENVQLIQIKGRGNFAGDSRDYITKGVVPETRIVFNTGPEGDFHRLMLEIATEFYGKENLR